MKLRVKLTRRLTIIRCVNQLSDVSKEVFLKELRKAMTQIIFDFQFLMDCSSMNFNESEIFTAAQNVVLHNKLGRVKKKSIKFVFKGMEEIYIEEELASVYYQNPSSAVSDKQKSELTSFVKGAIELLAIIKN